MERIRDEDQSRKEIFVAMLLTKEIFWGKTRVVKALVRIRQAQKCLHPEETRGSVWREI